FGDFFRGGWGGGGLFDMFFGGGGQRRTASDVRYDMSITLLEAAKGGEKEVLYSRKEACTKCGGTGAAEGSSPKTCPTCGGRGQVQQVSQRGYHQVIRVGPCSQCGGKGKTVDKPCPTCHGIGRVQQKRKIHLTIPEGVEDGQILRLRGEGDVEEGARGDLYVVVRVQPDPRFRRDGPHLWQDANISYTQAILGGTKEVPTLHGKTTINIPPGTQHGTAIRIKGEGVGRRGMPGDLYVRLKIAVPERVSGREKELLEELARIRGDDGPEGAGKRRRFR
ncbi:MAG: DnaJ C-terminal domain-containing protein, partial [Candidatus Thermoplasmatota archaeon]|nr:DnaJ C-terminal domain-containing protein [Candidatus Thermoplasmatota archaeon]